MNGKYLVSTGAKGPIESFNDDYASKGHQFFDVWAPEIATHYGEVFWTDQGALPLPADIVSKFKGKVMAITGYEQDQVMVTPTGQPGVNPSQDVSVPINWAYNHHYSTTITGTHSYMKKVPASKQHAAAHGERMILEAFDKPSAMLRDDPSIPTSQWFSEGNGGESRKSFHGYPNGFAQLIDSPDTWHITPMQIDSRNRDCGVTPADIRNCSGKFTPGPEPKSARYGYGIPKEGTNYSGVIECPCTDNWAGSPEIYGAATPTKQLHHDYKAKAAAQCGSDSVLDSAAECFTAVAQINVNHTAANTTVSSATLPPGCSVSVDAAGAATAFFNSLATSGASCNSAGNVYAGEATSQIGVTLSVALDKSKGAVAMTRESKGTFCSQNSEGVIAYFNMANVTAAAAEAALAQCEAACLADAKCSACSVDCPAGSAGKCRWVSIPQCGSVNTWDGIIAGDISIKASGEVTITMTGPATVWFAVGINAPNHLMADAPYTLIVNDTGVAEQKIGTCGEEAQHCAGTPLASTVKVLSNAIVNGKRTVVMTRGMAGATKDHYTFSPAEQSTIQLLTAVGSSFVFGYHAGHVPTTLTLTSRDGSTCVCDDGKIIQMCDQDGQHCSKFVKSCVAAPDGSLLEQANPTCNSGTYSGGLSCCVHGRILLDTAQERRPELLRYHMKFRFWYQEYNVTGGKPSHRDLPRLYWQTEANAGEYDIPPAFAKPGFPVAGYPNWPLNTPTPGTTCTGNCPDGDDCECVHTIHYKWTTGPMRLIYAGGHCHAPSCISMELYRNDTGELLCRQLPVYGTGTTGDKWDQAGYLTLPPCLWGDDAGLEPSVLLPAGVPLLSIKKNRNTFVGHYGEMASWQMRGVDS